jgi:hypothetical protein
MLLVVRMVNPSKGWYEARESPGASRYGASSTATRAPAAKPTNDS